MLTAKLSYRTTNDDMKLRQMVIHFTSIMPPSLMACLAALTYLCIRTNTAVGPGVQTVQQLWFLA